MSDIATAKPLSRELLDQLDAHWRAARLLDHWHHRPGRGGPGLVANAWLDGTYETPGSIHEGGAGAAATSTEGDNI